MYVHMIPLEGRPVGSMISSSAGDLPFTSNISPGCTVALGTLPGNAPDGATVISCTESKKKESASWLVIQ